MPWRGAAWPKRVIPESRLIRGLFLVTVPLFCSLCGSRPLTASLCLVGPRAGTRHAIFKSKTPSLQRSQTAYSGYPGASLPSRASGRCHSLESRRFSQARRLRAAQSADSLRIDSTSARGRWVSGLSDHGSRAAAASVAWTKGALELLRDSGLLQDSVRSVPGEDFVIYGKAAASDRAVPDS